MQIVLHRGDLPSDVSFEGSVAVDTETQGLDIHRDRLCLVQLAGSDGVCHLVQVAAHQKEAPSLQKVLKDEQCTKIFHYARFDLAVLWKAFGVCPTPVYCTKIASQLTRTYTDKHSLSSLCKEFLNIELNKQQQGSDWARDSLLSEQLSYAACDVVYLHALKERLDVALNREGRTSLAKACFDFLKTRVDLDLQGWRRDIFSH